MFSPWTRATKRSHLGAATALLKGLSSSSTPPSPPTPPSSLLPSGAASKKQDFSSDSGNPSLTNQATSSPPLQQRPRRLVVKIRNQDTNEKTGPPSWGIIKKRNAPAAVDGVTAGVSPESSKGGTGQPSSNAVIPPTKLKHSVMMSPPLLSNNTSPATATVSAASNNRPLPILNASALLDAKEYCIRSADASTNKSGTAAARRLLRGRQEFVDAVRRQMGAVRGSRRAGSSRLQAPPRTGLSYVVQGHGIPAQLLQDHINLADALLAHYQDAAECSFHNYRGSLELEWMRVRAKDGTNRACPWPAVNHQHQLEWDHSMQLYLHVMNRMATQLGMVLATKEYDRPLDTGTKIEHDEYSHDFAPSDNVVLQPRHWNVEFLRGLSFPTELLPTGPARSSNNNNHSNSNACFPIVEWTPMKGIAAPGHVCIRLQGFPSSFMTTASRAPPPDTKRPFLPLRRRKPQSVTLCFDACFRY